MSKLDRDSSIKAEEKMNHERNIFRYCVVFMVCLIYAYFYGGFFPYMLLYLVISLPIMSILHLIIIYMFLKISERLNGRIFVKGECASYYLLIQNSSIFYTPYITINMYIEGQVICKNMKSMRLSLGPLTTREFKYDLPLYYRGRYEIGVKSIEISDLLGLFSFRFSPAEPKSILVKPRITNQYSKSDSAARITEGMQASVYKEIGNDELVNIREYEYGDSYRKIHWKLTSKLNKAMIKETKNELNNDAIFIINLDRHMLLDEPALLKEDCLIEEIISNLYYHLNLNIPIKLCYYKNEPLSIKAATYHDFNNLYQLLSEVKFNQTYVFSQMMEYFIENEHNSNQIYIFTIKLDVGMLDEIIKIKNRGFDIELYYIDCEGLEEKDTKSQDISEILFKSNIHAYRLEPSLLPLYGTQSEIINGQDNIEVQAYEA